MNYDANGNMTDVDYKKMTVAYNYLNLPESITDNLTNSSLGFMYDAAGTKLRKTVTDAQDPNASYTQDYVQGIEYRDNNLEAIYFEEGRVIKDGDDYLYEYYLKDHLGNTRVVFSDKNNDGALQPFNNDGYPVAVDYSELLQENHYYPFGMNMDGPWTETVNDPENSYLYNGKELNEDFGLDLYEYGYRWYDPAIGRFTGVDPIADQFAWVSPYNYAENEPVGHIDLWGLQKAKCDCPEGTKEDEKKPPKNAYVSPGGINMIFEKAYGENLENVRPRMETKEKKDEPVSEPKEPETEESKLLYRGMKRDENSLPETGESARTLGVRPNIDIPIDENGNVYPMTGGMSVAPDSPSNLPKHRRPTGYGGTGKDPVWRISEGDLPPGLYFIQDSETHGTIQPTVPMSYEAYKNLLEVTGLLWNDIGGDQGSQ